MKAEELMKGNWVFSKRFQRPVQIVGIASHVLYYVDGVARTEKVENVSPIPLSPESLEKNGFKKGDFCWSWRKGNDEVCVIFARCRVVEISYTKLVFNPEDPEEIDYGSKMEFGYGCICAVHQLQQFLSLCSIEKEITLNGVIVDILLEPLP